jgi:Helix-turn-helix domain
MPANPEPRPSLEEVIAQAAKAAVAEAIKEISPIKEWFDTYEAAAYTGFSPELFESWRHKGEGPPYSQPSRRVRYKRSDLDEWLAKHRVTPGGR